MTGDNSAPREAIISVRALRKCFGPVTVLQDVSIDFAKGSVTTILGASGSGKSTLLRCINRLEVPTSGSIFLGGQEIGLGLDRSGRRRPIGTRALAAQRAEIGMVFQQFNLWPHLTVLENVVEAPLRVRRVGRNEAEATARHFLERVGMLAYTDRYPSRLSGGQQQRVAIARALAMRPQVMLFDEATSSLDPEMTGEVLQAMNDLAREGTTMIVVTHEMAFARDVSTRVLFLHQGSVMEDGPPDTVFRDPANEHFRRFLRGFELTKPSSA